VFDLYSFSILTHTGNSMTVPINRFHAPPGFYCIAAKAVVDSTVLVDVF